MSVYAWEDALWLTYLIMKFCIGTLVLIAQCFHSWTTQPLPLTAVPEKKGAPPCFVSSEGNARSMGGEVGGHIDKIFSDSFFTDTEKKRIERRRDAVMKTWVRYLDQLQLQTRWVVACGDDELSILRSALTTAKSRSCLTIDIARACDTCGRLRATEVLQGRLDAAQYPRQAEAALYVAKSEGVHAHIIATAQRRITLMQYNADLAIALVKPCREEMSSICENVMRLGLHHEMQDYERASLECTRLSHKRWLRARRAELSSDLWTGQEGPIISCALLFRLPRPEVPFWTDPKEPTHIPDERMPPWTTVNSTEYGKIVLSTDGMGIIRTPPPIASAHLLLTTGIQMPSESKFKYWKEEVDKYDERRHPPLVPIDAEDHTILAKQSLEKYDTGRRTVCWAKQAQTEREARLKALISASPGAVLGVARKADSPAADAKWAEPRQQ